MNNEKRCKGCGVLLQDENLLQEGYTTNLENDLCQRCCRMQNNGENRVIENIIINNYNKKGIFKRGNYYE